MGLFDKLLGGNGMTDPVRGQAHVVACSGFNSEGSIWAKCRMQLVVSAEGVPATSLDEHMLVHRSKWPSAGITLPITVDRANPRKVKIEWDEVQDSGERAAQSAEAIAAMMRGEPAPWAEAHGGTDPSKLTDEQEAKLKALGIDPFALTAARGFGPRMGTMEEAAADADIEVDDQLARLAKLGQLRDSGVLTPEEFEEQKRRILAG